MTVLPNLLSASLLTSHCSLYVSHRSVINIHIPYELCSDVFKRGLMPEHVFLIELLEPVSDNSVSVSGCVHMPENSGVTFKFVSKFAVK